MPVNDLGVLKVDSFRIFPLIGWLADQQPIRDWVVFQTQGHSRWLGSNLQEVAIVWAAIFSFLSAAISRTLQPADYTCYCNSNSCQKPLFCTALYLRYPLVWFTSTFHLDSMSVTVTNFCHELFASPQRPTSPHESISASGLYLFQILGSIQTALSLKVPLAVDLQSTCVPPFSLFHLQSTSLKCNWGWRFQCSFVVFCKHLLTFILAKEID